MLRWIRSSHALLGERLTDPADVPHRFAGEASWVPQDSGGLFVSGYHPEPEELVLHRPTDGAELAIRRVWVRDDFRTEQVKFHARSSSLISVYILAWR